MSEKVGWIKVYRQLQDCFIWSSNTPFDERSAWIDLLLSCNHHDKKILFDGKSIVVGRGQWITSIRKLSERWGWGRDKVARYLKMLEEEGMILKESDTKRTLITIERYEVFQGEWDAQSDTEKDTHKDTDKDTDKAQKKNEKNEKNIRSIVEDSNLSDSVKTKVNEWITYKKEKREGYKETGLKSLITQISNKEKEFGAAAVVSVIDLSMSNGWKGIIWDRIPQAKKPTMTFQSMDMRHNYDYDEMEKRLLQ